MPQLVIPLSSPAATDAGRFGPKAANLAALGRAGLPIPGGFCLDAEAYRLQLAALGLDISAFVSGAAEPVEARRQALRMRLGLLEGPLVPEILDVLRSVWRALVEQPGVRGVVRSSALVEDRFGSSFAGQFESYLDLASEADFLLAARSCWAALWSPRALRYMATHDVNPAETAMAVLIQPLVAARASGGGLSRTADGGMLLSATWGLGSPIAQGEVVPDRYLLSAGGELKEAETGRKYHFVGCTHGRERGARAISRVLGARRCLDPEQAVALGRMLRRAEDVVGGPAEIEWALDDAGFKLLQARPLHVQPAPVPDEIWLRHPGLNGHPAGIGWGSGRARVVTCECELSLVGPGDVLVTRVAGPALSQVLPHVAGVVAELGGSTSHLASLARERGIPMVLGVLDATRRIPDGVQVAVDGVAGVVRWMR
ncbi:MAG: PEP/pyruvate-binding domain-containing protein [Burkholderiales bacterium]